MRTASHVHVGGVNTRNRAFTLIELLVVIAIIGMLASIILASMNTARMKSRDSLRIQDQNALRTALELYATSNGNQYPSTGGTSNWRGTCSGFGSYSTSGSTGYIPNLAPTYIKVLPVDPKPLANGNGCYIYTSNGTDYMMLVYATVEYHTVSSNFRKRTSSPDGITFAIYTPGASAW